jgi:hypothetical protein
MLERKVDGVTIDLPQDSLDRIEVACRILGHGTTVEDFFRGALKIYEAVVLEDAKGAKFYIDRRDSKGMQPYELFEET